MLPPLLVFAVRFNSPDSSLNRRCSLRHIIAGGQNTEPRARNTRDILSSNLTIWLYLLPVTNFCPRHPLPLHANEVSDSNDPVMTLMNSCRPTLSCRLHPPCHSILPHMLPPSKHRTTVEAISWMYHQPLPIPYLHWRRQRTTMLRSLRVVLARLLADLVLLAVTLAIQCLPFFNHR